jgi:DNA-binding NarL/FixJ family response regulator
MKILIIAKSDLYRRALKSILEVAHPIIEFDEARNADEALEKNLQDKPDLIFMDLRELRSARRIKEASPGTVLVALSSYDFPELREAVHKRGGDDVLLEDCVNASNVRRIINPPPEAFGCGGTDRHDSESLAMD